MSPKSPISMLILVQLIIRRLNLDDIFSILAVRLSYQSKSSVSPTLVQISYQCYGADIIYEIEEQ